MDLHQRVSTRCSLHPPNPFLDGISQDLTSARRRSNLVTSRLSESFWNCATTCARLGRAAITKRLASFPHRPGRNAGGRQLRYRGHIGRKNPKINWTSWRRQREADAPGYVTKFMTCG